MNFYESIADYYHHIFPLNRKHIDFIKKHTENNAKKQLLDIGCGTGHLSYELSSLFKLVDAVDLDTAMIKKAKSNFSNKGLNFHELNMLHIQNKFGKSRFDTIISFGNTIVHLNSLNNIKEFFAQCRSILRYDGSFIFQIINYDRILDEGIKGLSDIDNDFIKFQRGYKINDQLDMIEFNTSLLIKENDKLIENSINLFPIRKKDVDSLLREVGFSKLDYFGSFMGAELMPDSIPLIVVCRP